MRAYRLIPAAERDRTLDHEDQLLAAAEDARATGWAHYEREHVIDAARRLGIVLWPALLRRIQRDARATTASPMGPSW